MERINPRTLSGPRAYFTDFDHRIVARTKNLAALRKKGERKLKALLLLKGHIVCAASHLATRFAYDFFRENTVLFRSEAMIPALRSDKSDLSELFARKRFKGKNEAVSFYKDYVQTTVSWELEDNSGWFRDRFLADLEDEKSVVRRHLPEDARDIVPRLVSEIRQGALLERELIDRVTKGAPRKFRRLLQNYRELIYHMSGARVVHCESALPQENYIDYDLADLRQKRARLSEQQILWKLLIELVFDSLQMELLPIEMLDALTFQDIMLIREPLLASNFQKRYDELIRQVVARYDAEQDVIFDIGKLESIRADLADTFNRVLQKELPNFLRHRALDQSKELASVSSSVALGVMGFVPGVSLVTSALSVMKDTPALVFNVGQTYSSIKSLFNLDEYYENKEKLIRRKVEECELSEKATMYEMVALLMDLISQRIRL